MKARARRAETVGDMRLEGPEGRYLARVVPGRRIGAAGFWMARRGVPSDRAGLASKWS